MRELKFRGYDGMDWVYSSVVSYEKETNTWYMIEDCSPDYDWLMVGNVGQYTGLKDKNDKEVYEGDVLRLEAHQDFFVDFHEGCFVARSTNKVQRINWAASVLRNFIEMGYEVIGNIYDNPELLSD